MDRTARIRALNDVLRTTFTGGRVMMSAGVAALDEADQAAVLEKVRMFDAFDDGNDPHREHDFVSVEHNGEKFFAKIDYYTPDLSAGSEDPSDRAQTARVMTIMRADEY
jgi:hypothetical protein